MYRVTNLTILQSSLFLIQAMYVGGVHVALVAALRRLMAPDVAYLAVPCRRDLWTTMRLRDRRKWLLVLRLLILLNPIQLCFDDTYCVLQAIEASVRGRGLVHDCMEHVHHVLGGDAAGFCSGQE